MASDFTQKMMYNKSLTYLLFNLLDGISSLTNGTFPLLDPTSVSNVLSDITDMASNIDLKKLNLTSTIVFLDFIDTYLNKTTVLTHLESLGLTECVSQVTQLFNKQSEVLNGNSLSTLQNEVSSFYSSYETFINSTFLPTSLKGGNEDLKCTSSLESLLTMMNNLTLLTTFTEATSFADNVLFLKNQFQSLLPANENDAIGTCNWPLKNSIWNIPNNGIVQCNNVNGGLMGNTFDIIDPIQKILMKNLLSTVSGITSGILSTNSILDECAINNLKDVTSTCNNDTSVVLTDALNLLSSTLTVVNNIDSDIIRPLKNNLNGAKSGNLSFSKYQLAEDFTKISRNMTGLLSELKTVQTLMEKVNLAMVGNVVDLVPKLYSDLDAFKLIPLDTQDLNGLKLFPALTNSSGGASLSGGLSELVSGISDALINIENEISSVIDDLGDTIDQLSNNLNSYLLDAGTEDTFYRLVTFETFSFNP